MSGPRVSVDRAGALLAVFGPLAVFLFGVALSEGMNLAGYKASPPDVNRYAVVDPAPDCRSRVTAVGCAPYYPAVPPPGYQPWEDLCDPVGPHWEVPMRINFEPPGCGNGAFVIANPQGGASIGYRGKAYGDTSWSYGPFQCRAQDQGLDCILRVEPWRRYSVVAVRDAAGRPAEAVAQAYVLAALAQGAVPIRWWYCLPFVGWAAWAAAVLAFAWPLLPGRGLASFWDRIPRWGQVAAVAGLGGALTGVLYAARPPDLGGLDKAPSLLLSSEMVGLLGALGVLVALATDAVRPALRQGGWGTLCAVFLVEVLGIPALATAVYVAFSGHGGWVGFQGISYKSLYYIYFALAAHAPILLFRETDGPSSRGGIRLFADAGWSTFWFVLAGVTLASAVAVYIAPLVPSGRPAGLLVGFYKPVSTVGLIINFIPMFLMMSHAVHLGERRPAWVRRLDEALGVWTGATHPTEQAEAAAEVLQSLLQHRLALRGDARHLSYARQVFPRSWVALDDHDRALFAQKLVISVGELDLGVANVLAALQRAPDRARRTSAPLLLVDRATGLGARGRLELSRYPDPTITTNREVELYLGQERLSELETELMQAVQVALAVVLDDLLWGGDRVRYRWEVRLYAEDRVDGASFQLPLSLLAWELATGSRRKVQRWAATGAVTRRGGRVLPVQGVDAKAALLEPGERWVGPTLPAQAVGRAVATVEEAIHDIYRGVP